MKKYKAQFSSIIPLETVRETDAFYWLSDNGPRNAKETTYHKLFDTFDDAKKYLIRKKQNEIEIYEINLRRLRDELAQIEILSEEL